MTDNEIIKALECCEANGGKNPNCEECPCFSLAEKPSNCYILARKQALDLISRQKADIERLQTDQEALINGQATLQKEIAKQQMQISNLVKTKQRQEEKILEQNKTIINLDKKLDEIKAEAIKEFAERLKEKSFYVGSDFDWLVEEKDIDNLVKETVGENNG